MTQEQAEAEIEDRIDRMEHDADAADAGADFASSLNHMAQADRLAEKAAKLRQQAQEWTEWAPVLSSVLAAAKEEQPQGGRPSKFVPETVCKLLAAIKAGNGYENACALAGVSYSTFCEWRQAGEEGKPGFQEMAEGVMHANALALDEAARSLRGHYTSDFRAPLAFLERRDRANWGRRVDVQVGGQIDHNHRLADAGPLPYSPADRTKLAAMLSRPALPDAETVDGEFVEVLP